MAKINPRYVSTFRAPTEYERQLEEARRRAAMAEALAQQEYQPMEGTVAPIPAAAPLVKALQGYMTARAGRQAEEAKAAAEKAGRTEAVDYMRSFDPEQRTVGVGDIAAMEASRPYLEGGQLRYDPASAVAAPNQRLMPAMTPTGEIDVSQPMQMQVGGPLSIAQKRARALEGFESVNPMVRDFAVAQYEKTMPKEAEYGTTPQYDDQGRAYVINKAGEVRYLGGIKAPAAAPAAVTPATIVKNGRRIVVDARTGREIGAAPETSPLVVNYGQPVAGVDEKGNPVFFQPSKGGGAAAIVPNVRPAPKEMNENQAKAAGFADRIAEASPVLDVPPPSVGTSILSNLPGGNFMLDPNQQSFYQAERNFINAVLRRESGAVISDEEFANARKQYIPQPGDSPQVLEQKRRNRETVKRSIMRDAGPSYQPVIEISSSLSNKPQNQPSWTPELQKELDELERRLQGK